MTSPQPVLEQEAPAEDEQPLQETQPAPEPEPTPEDDLPPAAEADGADELILHDNGFFEVRVRQPIRNEE